MLNYIFWDLESSINGVPATQVINEFQLGNARKIALIQDDSSGRVLRVEDVDIIKGNNAWHTKTDEEIAQGIIDQMNAAAIAAATTPTE